MAKLIHNGKEYEGDVFDIRGHILFIDGYEIDDFPAEKLRVEGEGVLKSDRDVVINGEFKGTIRARSVTLNRPATQVKVFATDVHFNDKAINCPIHATNVTKNA